MTRYGRNSPASYGDRLPAPTPPGLASLPSSDTPRAAFVRVDSCCNCHTVWSVTLNWRFYFLMHYGPDRCPDCVETIEY